MKVREPVARPLDIVSVELLLSASQAFLTGVLVYLAIGIWDDRGVGLGPTAAILALLGLAVGASWLFWLLGGTGWPMAASNTPAALFLGFALLLGWQGQGLVRLDALPLVLALAAAIYGIACGVFLDSPRRWRWDQRQRLRPGTQVPRVSPTTKALVARVPRSLPRRDPSVLAPPDVPGVAGGPATSTGAAFGSLSARVAGSADELAPAADVTAADADEAAAGPAGPERAPLRDEEVPTGPGADADLPLKPAPPPAAAPRATDRLARGRSTAASPGASEAQRTPSGIELPTSVEPRAQRSPWAWAAPPEWNRDEDEEQPGGGSSPGS